MQSKTWLAGVLGVAVMAVALQGWSGDACCAAGKEGKKEACCADGKHKEGCDKDKAGCGTKTQCHSDDKDKATNAPAASADEAGAM